MLLSEYIFYIKFYLNPLVPFFEDNITKNSRTNHDSTDNSNIDITINVYSVCMTLLKIEISEESANESCILGPIITRKKLCK